MTVRFAPLIRRRWVVLALTASVLAATGCRFLEMQGDIEVRSDSMGTDYAKHYVPQDKVQPIEPGTRFELELREYCPDETNCREDEIEVQDVRFEQESDVLILHGTSDGGRLNKSQLLQLEAVGRGESTMTVELTRAGEEATLQRRFRVVEPNGIGLRECEDRQVLLYGAPFTLLRSVLYDGRRMISNGIDPDADPGLLRFDPPGALIPAGLGGFWGRFRKVEPGDVRVESQHTIHYGDYYGYEPVEDANGSLRYRGVELTREGQIDVAVPSQTTVGTDFPVDIDVDLDDGLWLCSDVHFEVDVLTPGVCGVEQHVRDDLIDPNHFSSAELVNPRGLDFEAHSRGTCEFDVTIPQPGRWAPTKRIKVDVLSGR